MSVPLASHPPPHNEICTPITSCESDGRYPVPIDVRFVNLGEMMNLGGLDGSVSTIGGMVKLTGKAAGLARRAVYAVSVKKRFIRFCFGWRE